MLYEGQDEGQGRISLAGDVMVPPAKVNHPRHNTDTWKRCPENTGGSETLFFKTSFAKGGILGSSNTTGVRDRQWAFEVGLTQVCAITPSSCYNDSGPD